AFCLGCCWFLMGLLFYGGVMNLYWIVGLAVFVLLEKMSPAGYRFGSIAGIGLIVWGGKKMERLLRAYVDVIGWTLVAIFVVAYLLWLR
ncbi:MAG: DUF2182 domain-containing protein, partial [Acidiferrobacterales bacterium]